MSSIDQLLTGERRKLSGLRRDLLAWVGMAGRDFPWRNEEAETFEKIVVEVLLQRTTASAVSGFYRSFFDRYPNWEALAAAQPPDLEKFLRPLGLWRRRAASLLGLARYAVSRDGHFPCDASAHRDVPAVGQYVSNAILMFQHGKAMPLLDVNMARVIERFVRPRRLADIRHDPWLQAAARWFVRGSQPEKTNWAILDFAALVCKARSPLCPKCPVRTRCAYYRAASKRSISS